jgi:hypothetical protein
MADSNVFITGAAEGALSEALNGIPPWATQKTAEDIEKILGKILGVQVKALAQAVKNLKAAGGDGSSNNKTVNDELDKLVKNLKRVNEEDAKRKKREKDEDKEGKDRLSRDKKRKLADEALTRGFNALAGAGTKILAVQKQYFTTSEDLFKSGVNLLNGNDTTTSSMMALNQIVTLTGMRLETFQKVVEKYNSSINAVGVNKFAKTLSLTSTKLIALGYSSEQQAELLGTLVESESSYMDIRGKSQQELADDAERLGKQMTRLSLLTGQTNAQLQENLKSLAKNTDSTVVAAVYGEEAAKRMNVFASSFKDADIGQMFQKLAAATQPAITKTFQSLAQAGQAPLAEEFTRIAVAARDGAISAEQAQKQTSDLAQKVNSTTLQSLALLADKGAEGAAETLSVITKLRTQGNTTSKATEKQVDAAIESQAALSRFSTALEKTASLGQRTFPLLETQVNLATAALEKFNSVVIAATDIFSAETRSWIAIGIEVFAGFAFLARGTKALTGSFDLLKSGATLVWDGIKLLGNSITWVGRGLMSLAGPVAAVTGAFLAGYSIGTVIYEMISKFDWFNNMMDKIFIGLDHVMKYIPGLSGDAKERIATREKIAAQATAEASAKKSTISVPKEPAQTTIKSPSAVPANPEKTTTSPSGEPTTAPTPRAATAPAPSSNDINSVMTYQTSILVQLLETSQNLVSVNRDILKYTKVHS